MSRQSGLIATIATVLLCGGPSCLCLLIGVITAANQSDVVGIALEPIIGIELACLSLLGFLIPVFVGLAALRGNKS